MSKRSAGLILALLAAPTPALADEPRPAITFRLDAPDRQAHAVIRLFRGSRAKDPAAALAAWKRASREPDRLGKPLEALIAAFNPAMADELRSLDGSEAALWFVPGSKSPVWGAVLPRDDGTFAALATALVLSGGAAEAPWRGLAVDRLGLPDSALMARSPKALLVGGSREGLARASAMADRPDPAGRTEGLSFRIDPGAIDAASLPALRGWRAALGEARGPISGSARLEGPALRASVDVGSRRPDRSTTVDPVWLRWLPIGRASAVFVLAVAPEPEAWDRAFRLVDAVEKSDPDRQKLAPARLRLGLAARSAGLRLDADLLPHLRGVAGWIGPDRRPIDRAALVLHLDDERVATRIFEGLRLPAAAAPGEVEGQGRRLGDVAGRPIRVARAGADLILGWGEGTLDLTIEAGRDPENPALTLFRERLAGGATGLLVATWAGRLPGIGPADAPLAGALAGSPPILWSGGWAGPEAFRLEASWSGLDSLTQRFLDRLPLDPPPDR